MSCGCPPKPAPKPCCPSKPMPMPCCPVKCPRKGKVTRNAFLNFLRVFRRRHCDLSITQVAVLGAKKWNCMSSSAKARFNREARCAPKMKYCRHSHPRRRMCPRPKRRCPRPKRRKRMT